MDTDVDVYSKTCPTREVLDQIADKWTTLVIGILAQGRGPVRFGQLRKAVQGISQKMLTQTLRGLERDGLVVRIVYPVIPPHVEYSLTALGGTLEDPLRAIAIWAQEHSAEVRVAQAAFDQARSGGGKSAAAA